VQLALLGLDDQTLAITVAAIADSRHRIELVSDLPAEAAVRLKAAGIGGTKAVPWESLLVGGACDAVVVASAPDESAEDLRTEQLRKLVQEGVPLLVAHPVLSSVLDCYEIDMIRRESGALVLPYLPARFNAGIARLRDALGDAEHSPLGMIEQIVFERTASDRTRRAVLAHFARDVDWIRAITGDVVRIGALGSPDPHTAYANLTVQMSGESSAVIRWSILPGNDNVGRLKIVGTKDQLEISPSAADLPDAFAADFPINPASAEPADVEPEVREPSAALVALERLQQAIARREQPAEWSEAIRDVELADAIPRSLARGRTIEVHHEQPTEEGTFKGLMTSLGCGLLLIGLGLVIVLAMPWRTRIIGKGWRQFCGPGPW
jgi:predicted dehydrogenase